MSRQYGQNPTFHISHVDGAGYGNHPTQFQYAHLQQWPFPGTRTSMNSVPSPTNTVHTAPLPATSKRAFLQRTANNVEYEMIDPNLPNYGHLAPPQTRSFSAVQNHAEQIADPMARFYQNEGPWDPMRNLNVNATRNVFDQPQGSFGPYRQGPCSDIESNVLRSESGYYTRSDLSIDPVHVNQEVPSEIIMQTGNLNVTSIPTVPPPMIRTASDHKSVSQHSNRSANQRQQFSCSEPGCSVISKCNSDHKKHMLRHNKDFVCDVQGCKRGGKGFSTVNDLDRHRKSVHSIDSHKTKSYLCAHKDCRTKTKLWPRLDNFKQHIQRMHKDGGEDDLIRRSEYHPQEAPSAVQPSPVDPAHLLAGMGSDSTLATEDLNDNTLSIDTQNFAYPQFMSIGGRSNPDTSRVSPSTNSLDLSFSQFSMSSSQPIGRNTSAVQSFPDSTGNLTESRLSRRKSSHVSPTKTSTKSTPDSAHDQNATSQLQLSNPPQTKSEQQRQRQVLDKLAKASISIEDIVLRVLDDQQRHGNSNIGVHTGFSDDDWQRASQAIAELVKQNVKPAKSHSRRSPPGSVSGTQRCPYEDCGFFGRICDLNKHVKRHQKPYGCTYPKCYKKFGAKSDWKRHENSQHFQQETFRCDYATSPGENCGQHYFRLAQFQTHLEREHEITSRDVLQAKFERCKIGKNCQGSYWCGFCRDIIKLQHRHNDAWDERFDHIAKHFEKDTPKKNIDDWICVEENETKKKLQEKLLEDKWEGRADDEDFDDDESPITHDGMPAHTARPSPIPVQKAANKRSASADFEESDRPEKQPTFLWHCCECGDGPFTTLQATCICQHQPCNGCQGAYADDKEL